MHYGNTGCRIFKGEMPKNIHTWRKLFNFESWCNGEVSKIALIWLSKSTFYVKNHRTYFFSLKNTNLGAHCFFLTFLITSFFKSCCYKNDAQFLTARSPHTNSQKSWISLSWVLGKNISSFVSPARKLNNPY